MDKDTFKKINELGKLINYPLIKENDGTHQYWMYSPGSGSGTAGLPGKKE